MVNSVTCKIVLRKDQKNAKGMVSIVAQCFINGQRVVIPLSLSVHTQDFDERREFVKSSHPQAISCNQIIADARSRVYKVQSEANVKNIQLNRVNFRSEFTLTQTDLDFIGYYDQQLTKRIGELELSSLRQHRKSLMKLMAFRERIPFSMLTPALLADFEQHLKQRCKNSANTVYSDMKNIRTYVYRALKEGVQISNPFLNHSLKRGGTRIIFCTIEEQQRLIHLYDGPKLPEHLRYSLCCFLVSCYTSLRISDVRRCEPSWIEKNTLSYLPKKTKRFNKYIHIPLSDVAKRMLEDFFAYRKAVKLKADQKINDDLKVIADYCRISKRLSMHVGRHSFATTFLELGGSIEVLRDLMGHSKIQDTMIYVHINDRRKAEQMKFFNNKFQ